MQACKINSKYPEEMLGLQENQRVRKTQSIPTSESFIPIKTLQCKQEDAFIQICLIPDLVQSYQVFVCSPVTSSWCHELA